MSPEAHVDTTDSIFLGPEAKINQFILKIVSIITFYHSSERLGQALWLAFLNEPGS